MAEKILSVFIDESGDFGEYNSIAPYYLVAMVLHNQDVDIHGNITSMNTHMSNLGYREHAIHTGPLIRRESVYTNELMEDRKRLFNALFNFARKLEFNYICPKIKKSECADVISMTGKLSRAITNEMTKHEEFWNSFDRVIVYYDNGQVELTKILSSVFNVLYTDVEFRKVKPVEYKLFQVADLVCTLRLLEAKIICGAGLSADESRFFGGPRKFRHNILRYIKAKEI